MQEKIKEILDQIETVIVGKNEVMERILMAILAGGHVLMEDVPGVGKTTTAMTFARVLGLETRRVQFTSDTMPSDIIGFSVYDKDTGKLVYKPGAVMTNLLLADEINRTSSKTQSALLEAMEEGHVSIDGKTHPLPDPFIVLATQNPAGSAGTQMLPNSQLDRFLVKLTMGYPDFKSQVSILEERHTENPLDRVQPVVLPLQGVQLLLVIEGGAEVAPHVFSQGGLRLGQVVVRQAALDRLCVGSAALALHQMLPEPVAKGPHGGQQVRLGPAAEGEEGVKWK